MRGTLNGRYVTSRVKFFPGVNNDGYWTSKHMQDQLSNDVIPLFEMLHPNMVGVFLFDQSSNHKAFSDDALVANRMQQYPAIHKPGSVKYKKGYYVNSVGVRVEQDFYVSKTFNYNALVKTYFNNSLSPQQKRQECQKIIDKGHEDKRHNSTEYFIDIKRTLADRGLNHSLNLKCTEDQTSSSQCCATHLLQSQPDFQEQRSLLETVVASSGHLFELYPKYHYECNWIERYWGDNKRVARQNCDYSFAALKEHIDSFLDSVCPSGEPPLKIRRYHNRCMRYIQAYSQGSDVLEAKEIVEQFSKLQKSHRKLRLNQ
ncbi:hypothetical protein BD560DRAFT_439120 [Blakeslea trispora]|nr:hypothetical protein BD560DRAFT_439120 [Blakeslea trispora]